MAELRQLRVKVFVTDGVPLKAVKDRLRTMIRQAGQVVIGDPETDGADLLDPPTIYFDAAEVYQGAETAVRRKKESIA